jgi:hypothetical protein
MKQDRRPTWRPLLDEDARVQRFKGRVNQVNSATEQRVNRLQTAEIPAFRMEPFTFSTRCFERFAEPFGKRQQCFEPLSRFVIFEVVVLWLRKIGRQNSYITSEDRSGSTERCGSRARVRERWSVGCGTKGTMGARPVIAGREPAPRKLARQRAIEEEMT